LIEIGGIENGSSYFCGYKDRFVGGGNSPACRKTDVVIPTAFKNTPETGGDQKTEPSKRRAVCVINKAAPKGKGNTGKERTKLNADTSAQRGGPRATNPLLRKKE